MEKIIESRQVINTMVLEDGTKTYEVELWMFTNNHHCIVRTRTYFTCPDIQDFISVDNAIWTVDDTGMIVKQLSYLKNNYHA